MMAKRTGKKTAGALAGIAALLVVGLISASAAASTGQVIKLATLVPDRSVWGNPLREMGAAWKEQTAGRISLRIYPDGIAGDDIAMVRKMRIGQLHAATMTIAGLTEIDPAFSVFAIPLFFSTDDELLHVLRKLEPELRRRLEDKGFVLLHWGHGGWLHLFSTKKVKTVDDFKTVKFFVWAGDDRMVRWWKDSGFRPVALAFTDIMPSLQTGVIEALPSTPLAALSLQWFNSAPNMLDLRLAPLVGATVMTSRAWKKISSADQRIVLNTARKAEVKLFNDIPPKDLVALSEMQKRGLAVTVVTGTPMESGWRDLALRFAERMRHSVVPPEILDAALREREAYRNQLATPPQS